MIVDDAVLAVSPGGSGRGVLDRFRAGFHACLTRRSDVLMELTDAVACSATPVTDLARLSLTGEHRRGHGALYDALNAGRIDQTRLRRLIAATPIPVIAGPDGRGRIVLAVDVSNWLRPDAATSRERMFCHTYPRGRGQAQMIPGWPYSLVAALEPGPSSWTALLDAVRLRPGDDATAVTAAQLRAVIEALIAAGQHTPGDRDILIVCDAGYDAPRLAWLLTDLPVTLVGRLRSDRVFHARAGTRKGPTKGRPPRHGDRLALREPATQTAPDLTSSTTTDRYGDCTAIAFTHQHPRLGTRGGWRDHQGPLPIIEGTVIGLRVDHLPGDRTPKPLWLWASKPCPDTTTELDHWWSMFCRRFDIEHTFRFLKQALGWTRPRLADPEAADRWTWLIIAAHTTLRLARTLTADLRLPWQPPQDPTGLTPGRVRAGYHRIHQTLPRHAKPPKHTRPGPGRPKGRKNKHKRPTQPIGTHQPTG